MIAVTEISDNLGLWGFLAVLVTQGVIVLNQRRGAKVNNSTNLSVNHVGENEPTLINQVREHGRQLQVIDHRQQWTVEVLQEVARQSGVRVPPLPENMPYTSHPYPKGPDHE
jgi:hypothetical protein